MSSRLVKAAGKSGGKSAKTAVRFGTESNRVLSHLIFMPAAAICFISSRHVPKIKGPALFLMLGLFYDRMLSLSESTSRHVLMEILSGQNEADIQRPCSINVRARLTPASTNSDAQTQRVEWTWSLIKILALDSTL